MKEVRVSKILKKLDELIEAGDTVEITDVFEELSIFDWFKDTLTKTDMKNMRSFLEVARKYGFDSYACFKVGATGCANGMWAYTDPSENGYAPSTGEALYRSFKPSYTAWNTTVNGRWIFEKDVPRQTVIRSLERRKA